MGLGAGLGLRWCMVAQSVASLRFTRLRRGGTWMDRGARQSLAAHLLSVQVKTVFWRAVTGRCSSAAL